MARPTGRWGIWGVRGAWRAQGAVLGLGALWWWAVLRLALSPDAGALEGAVAAGGWGLSLLPVHCVPKARAVGAVAAGRWARAWRAGGAPTASLAGAANVASSRGAAAAASPTGPTTASPPRRSDAGSDPS
jgi:hypothetical protein